MCTNTTQFMVTIVQNIKIRPHLHTWPIMDNHFTNILDEYFKYFAIKMYNICVTVNNDKTQSSLK